MLALLSCLVLNAAEPEIYFSFDRSARADFGGGADTRQEIAGTGNEQGVIGNLIRGTDKTPDKILTDGIAGKALRIGNSSDGKAKQTWEYKPFTPSFPAARSVRSSRRILSVFVTGISFVIPFVILKISFIV